MIRIAGINLPDEKRIEIALTYIYGIGPSTSRKILEALGIDLGTKAKDISDEDANKLRNEIEKKHKVEGELKHEVKSNIKRLKEVGSYRGSRHIKGLPVHGQRTKTNSRTVRGNVRKTMGSGRRAESKT
ncbi:MAG TPA: 30S ribosomal protein S13 [Candidatus Moranbacteria bacterium]|jgi:small subunit ribosomal protein S13|nr:30S ribosomal protein S13 [Candidatus Moranbacteria bacterium]HPX94232.1 30S ribosomal protein S13 [Candidatus Moranbacteria bacterium]HQB59679.1 30S ribosomal protein S13 [Candidatus Moranbacteria bacterium]